MLFYLLKLNWSIQCISLCHFDYCVYETMCQHVFIIPKKNTLMMIFLLHTENSSIIILTWNISLFKNYMSSEVRECLKLDQDHKRCFAHYKQVKKLNKLIESAEELIRDGR